MSLGTEGMLIETWRARNRGAQIIIIATLDTVTAFSVAWRWRLGRNIWDRFLGAYNTQAEMSI